MEANAPGDTPPYLRDFDTASGREFWRDKLPPGSQAMPISYRAPDGRQVVAVVAGVHGSLFTKHGDFVA